MTLAFPYKLFIEKDDTIIPVKNSSLRRMTLAFPYKLFIEKDDICIPVKTLH